MFFSQIVMRLIPSIHFDLCSNVTSSGRPSLVTHHPLSPNLALFPCIALITIRYYVLYLFLCLLCVPHEDGSSVRRATLFYSLL